MRVRIGFAVGGLGVERGLAGLISLVLAGVVGRHGWEVGWCWFGIARLKVQCSIVVGDC